MKYCNIISIIGLSNAGKSYLFNKLLNEKISLTNKKIQFTRKLIFKSFIINKDKYLLIDTPGYILNPKYKLHYIMINLIKYSINISNFIIYVAINNDIKNNKYFLKKNIIIKEKKNILIIYNNKKEKKINKFYLNFFKKNRIIILNKSQINNSLYINKIFTLIKKVNNNISKFKINYNKNFIIKDIIRYYIYNFYNKEIPYCTDILVNKILKDENKVYIEIIIYIEKLSQLKILIGKKGNKINKLSSFSRFKIKKMLNIKSLYLNIKFKIIKWKNNKYNLKSLGY
ncbi:MAG: 50S ribosome-binding GTPase [Candidatus Shikimatogenerans bostrichidophilus]|nr:MAG: 50S ribosome-binding GTPase [Candidatus Shikimatogenerans bostrichidophilus]